MWQVRGLNMSSALTAGRAAGLAAPDVSRFTRLQTLHLRNFSPRKAAQDDWRLALPASLRILHLVKLDAPGLEVSVPHCTKCALCIGS